MDLPSRLALAAVGGDIVKATEDLEGGVALDTVVGAELLVLGAVDLDELDALLGEGGSGLLVLRGQSLAVAAPGSVDCAASDVSQSGDYGVAPERNGWGELWRALAGITYTRRERGRSSR